VTAAAEHLRILAAALTELSAPAEIGSVVMELGVAALGAFAGVIALPVSDAPELELLSSIGYPPEACMSVGRRWAQLASIPIAEASRTGEPVFVESPKSWGERYLGGNAPKTTASAAWAAMPLELSGVGRGALLWAYDSPREFSDEDRRAMSAIARECAQALARVTR
jgi:GAF domain-containing protein